jgi:hypothetical protein
MMFESNAKGAATQVEQAAFNLKMVGFLSLEVIGTALAVGLYRQSLATGLIVFLGLYLMFSLETMKHALALIFSVFWGALTFSPIHTMDANEPMAWIIAGMVAAASLAAHLWLFRWQKDIE